MGLSPTRRANSDTFGFMRPTISASQISTVRDCAAKWAFDKIDGIERVEGGAAALGTRIHTLIERWFDHGEVPAGVDGDADSIRAATVALTIIQHLPPRGPGVETEREIHFYWKDADVFVKGFIDLFRGGEVPHVFDHKSTSSISKYAKSEEDLALDPQALFYGLAARLDHHERTGVLPEFVDLQWTYGETVTPKTKLPQSRPVRVRQSLKVLEEGLESLKPYAAKIRTLHETVKSGTEVEGDLSACWKYGPCPYRDRCTTYQQSRSTPPAFEEKPMVIDSNLLARLSAASNSAEAVHDAGPEITPEPHMVSMPTPEVLVASEVLPPDAAKDVSENDPPPPPLVESREKGAKAARSRRRPGPRGEEVVELPFTPVSAPAPVTDLGDIRAALKGLVVKALGEHDLDNSQRFLSALLILDGVK